MKILFVAATYNEISPLLHLLSVTQKTEQSFYEISYRHFHISILITGVGITHTAFHLGRLLSQKTFDWAFNIGIAGSFDHQIKIGQIVRVHSQVFGDIGVEDGETFIPLSEMDFFDENQFPYQNGMLFNSHPSIFPSLQNLKTVSAMTVNKVLGSESSIFQAKKHFHPHIESMEGAAFFYSCLMSNQPFVELRAISNFVEVRNKSKWNIPLAINNLNELLIEMVEL